MIDAQRAERRCEAAGGKLTCPHCTAVSAYDGWSQTVRCPKCD